MENFAGWKTIFFCFERHSIFPFPPKKNSVKSILQFWKPNFISITSLVLNFFFSCQFFLFYYFCEQKNVWQNHIFISYQLVFSCKYFHWQFHGKCKDILLILKHSLWLDTILLPRHVCKQQIHSTSRFCKSNSYKSSDFKHGSFGCITLNFCDSTFSFQEFECFKNGFSKNRM